MERLGRYTLTRVLGAGGAGQVYQGVMTGPGGFRRTVAVKVLHEGAGALRREARIGGLLRHQHLVDVYEVGQDGEQWFAAMEFCEGGSLSERLPLPPRAVVEVGLQVAAALKYAHEELGLIHRDLKPDNLLLRDGVVKVADLGIARARGFRVDRRISGTPGFMPPEQRHGEPLDARADIYALGITLVVLATAQLPDVTQLMSYTLALPSTTLDALAPAGAARTWVGEPSSSSQDTLADWLVPPTSPSAPPSPPVQVPDWLAPVVERCLAPSPDDRFEDMDELAQALKALEPTGPDLKTFLGWQPPPPPARSPDTNLGEEPDAFVGRVEERRALAELLERGGLVTLLGPAGVGKSRLAAAAARQWRARSGGAAWFCSLSPARTAEGLLAAVAAALDVPLNHGDTDAHVTTLGHAIASHGPAVVILDNFEQLAHLSHVVARWRAMAPEVRLVVTSRQALALDGERRLGLEPLRAEDARALVVNRAQQRGVDLGDDPDLDELVERLEGQPLALELAAGRLGVLSVRDVLDRLGLRLLRRGTGDRHGTLMAALDWSWELLEARERVAFAQLSVFEGSFTLEAAEAVLDLSADCWPVDAVQALVDRSLVRALGEDASDGQPEGEPRFGMYASLRDYAASKLADPAPSRRHAAFFAGLCAPEALDALEGGDGTLRWWALHAELDNLLAAARRSLTLGDGLTSAALAAGVFALMERSGPYAAARDLLERACGLLDAADPDEQRALARLLGDLGLAEQLTGRGDLAEAHFRRALDMRRALGSRSLEARALQSLGNLHLSQGALETAQEYFRDARRLYRALGDRTGEGSVRSNLGHLALQRGRLDEAGEHLLAALALLERGDYRRGEASALGNLAVAHMLRGQVDEARATFERSLTLMRRLGNRAGEAPVLINLGFLALDQGRAEAALARFHAALRLYQELGDRRGEGLALSNLGNLQLNKGRLQDAHANYRTALAIAQEHGNRSGEANALGYLGHLHKLQGRLDVSREHFLAAQAIHEEVGDRRGQNVALSNLGVLHRLQGRPAEARAHFLEALAGNRAIGERRGEGLSLRELGTLDLEQGRLEEAGAQLQASLAITRALADRGGEAVVIARLGTLRARSGEVEEARELLSQSEALLRDLGNTLKLGEVLAERGRVEAEAGRREPARALLAEAGALAEALQAGPDSELGRAIARLSELLAHPSPRGHGPASSR